ncbi:PEP-CTERM sorting domain-containing protein [Planctomycetales bacterium ZRK34]|nr:PEP-CTERM sorting domain-containing protein [Planctomycetales bacterium ZRK34]
MKNLGIIAALAAVGLFGVQQASAGPILDSAEILWQFDYADSGSPVTTGQITDSSGNGHDASSVVEGSLLNWTTVPANGPGGASTVGSAARGLQFNPVVNIPGTADDVTSPGFIAAGDAINGTSSTVFARFYWDGYVSDDANAQMFWLLNNSLGSGGVGYLFGVRNDNLSLHMTNGSFDSTQLKLTPGSWYDVAAVFDDKGDGDTANDEITLYLYKNGQLLSHTISHVVPTTGGSTNIIVGSETLGTGSVNHRKGFDGTVDYIAFWDTALSEGQISALVPEPATLGMFSLGALALIRRRR